MSADRTFEGWAILELMGHRKLAGRVSEANIGGGAFIRIDVPGDGADVATQFYAPGAVYCITPCTEDLARRTAAGCRPAPVTEYELSPARRLAPPSERDDTDDDPETFTCEGCDMRHSIEDRNTTEDDVDLCDTCWEEAIESSTIEAAPNTSEEPPPSEEPF